MSSLEKRVYFGVAVIVYLATLVVGIANADTTLVSVAITLGLAETAHWYYGLKHRKIGMYFWGLSVVVATMALLVTMTIGF